MRLNLGISNLTEVNPFDDILAGLHPTMEVSEIVTASGQNLKLGNCLGLISAKNNRAKVKNMICDTDTTDSSEELSGILGC